MNSIFISLRIWIGHFRSNCRLDVCLKKLVRIDDTDFVYRVFSGRGRVSCLGRVTHDRTFVDRIHIRYSVFYYTLRFAITLRHLRGCVHLIENIYERFVKTKMTFLIARTIHGISWREWSSGWLFSVQHVARANAICVGPLLISPHTTSYLRIRISISDYNKRMQRGLSAGLR